MKLQTIASVLGAARSPLKPIAPFIERAVDFSAPEKKEQLWVLKDSLNIRFLVDTVDGGVSFSARLNKEGIRSIKMGLGAMERLWAYCYGFTIFFDIARKRPQGVLIEWKNEPEASMAWRLLRWAYRSEQNRTRLKWCKRFPKPGTRTTDPYIENTDKFFTLVLGFIVLHEVGHHALNHFSEVTLPNEKVRQELEADEYAANMMLSMCPRDEEDQIFVARSNAVSTGLALLSGMELGISPSGERTHPKIPERLLTFFGRHLPETAGAATVQQYAMYFATILLSAFMQNAGIQFIHTPTSPNSLCVLSASFLEYLSNDCLIASRVINHRGRAVFFLPDVCTSHQRVPDKPEHEDAKISACVGDKRAATPASPGSA